MDQSSPVGVVQVGIGNFASLLTAFREAGHSAVAVTEPDDLKDFSKAVLPGVGNFGAFGLQLRDSGFGEALVAYCSRPDTYLLGVCVGAQILMNRSEESPDQEGLGLLGGYVRRVTEEESHRVPRIGWDYLCPARNRDPTDANNQSRDAVHTLGPRYYFAHSYCMQPDNESAVVAVSNSSRSIPAIVRQSNILAVQFHPERSGVSGRLFLDQFMTGGFRAS